MENDTPITIFITKHFEKQLRVSAALLGISRAELVRRASSYYLETVLKREKEYSKKNENLVSPPD